MTTQTYAMQLSTLQILTDKAYAKMLLALKAKEISDTKIARNSYAIFLSDYNKVNNKLTYMKANSKVWVKH